MNKISRANKKALIRIARELPQGDALRRAILGGLKKAEEEGGGKGGGAFIKFLEEVGDEKVKNPDTGNTVKVKSLSGPKGKALVQKEFEKWKEDQKKKKDDKKPKDKGDKKPEDKDKGDKKPKDKGEKKLTKDMEPWDVPVLNNIKDFTSKLKIEDKAKKKVNDLIGDALADATTEDLGDLIKEFERVRDFNYEGGDDEYASGLDYLVDDLRKSMK